jgi:hypothetical protein
MYTISLPRSYIAATEKDWERERGGTQYIEEMEINGRETLSSESGRKNINLVEVSRALLVRSSDVSGAKMNTLDYLL